MFGDHDHSSGEQRPDSGQALRSGLVIVLGFAVVEAVGGWWADSLALLGDAGHMFSDAAALAMAAVASHLAGQPPSSRNTFGLERAEVVAALINGVFMLLVVVAIAWHAIERLQQPVPVAGGTVILIATIGLIINIILALKLHGSEQSLNVRAAMLHVIGDLLGSVAALAAGTVILLTGWTPIDPLLSLFICVLIVISSVRLLRDVLHVIMQSVPPDIRVADVEKAMLEVDTVVSIHDLHIWTLTGGKVVLSAHVMMTDLPNWEAVLAELQQCLEHRFDIVDVTLQPEAAARP
jgi:cobalt-zinc-cadmium efflux system protein